MLYPFTIQTQDPAEAHSFSLYLPREGGIQALSENEKFKGKTKKLVKAVGEELQGLVVRTGKSNNWDALTGELLSVKCFVVDSVKSLDDEDIYIVVDRKIEREELPGLSFVSPLMKNFYRKMGFIRRETKELKEVTYTLT